MGIEFKFIGWCKEDNHDKVWTSFKAGDRWYAGWGRRGKKITFKDHGTGWSGENSLKRVQDKKKAPRGNYEAVDSFQLFAIFPDFEEKVEAYLAWDTLANKIR